MSFCPRVRSGSTAPQACPGRRVEEPPLTPLAVPTNPRQTTRTAAGYDDAKGAAAAKRLAAAGPSARGASAQRGGGRARVSQKDRFQNNAESLGEFLHFVNRLPNATSPNERERQLHGFLARTRQNRAKMNNRQRNLLLKIHPNLLKPSVTLFVDTGPSSEWQVVFNNLASSSGDDYLEYRDPVTNTSYLSSTGSKSLSEYLIRRMGVMTFVKPTDLTPSAGFELGDVRMNLLYILHPHLRPRWTINPSVINTSKRLVSHFPGHKYCGALFLKSDLPECLCKDICRLRNSLLPDKVRQDMQDCDSAHALVHVIQRNLDLFDTCHHDCNGRFQKGILKPTAESRSKQPRRTTFSCSLTPVSTFPELSTSVQRLFSYVGGCRPIVDCRCRVMTPLMHNVIIKVWAGVRQHLSPASQLAPPNHVQVLYYFEQFNAAMNPHRDRDTTKQEIMIPQIAGTDVLVISMGADMIFKLISPDFEKGQSCQFTQTEARQNAKMKNLSEDITLSDVSVYKHTAHDDTVLQHMAYFPANIGGPGNRMRVALLCRTLSISVTSCANSHGQVAAAAQ